MKRELGFIVGVQSQLAGSLGGTRPPSIQTQTQSPSSCEEDIGCKRFKVAKVNGFIVYSRVRKSSSSSSSRPANQCHQITSGDEIPIVENETHIEEKQVVEIVNKENHMVENVIGEQPNNNNAKVQMAACKDEPMSEPEVKVNGAATVCGGSGVKRNKPRRFAHSKLKLKLETVEVKVNGLETVDSGAISRVDVEMIAEGSALTPPKKNLELKMSKKIQLDNVPMTVKELFETGLLEGVPVVYMGGKKVQFL